MTSIFSVYTPGEASPLASENNVGLLILFAAFCKGLSPSPRTPAPKKKLFKFPMKRETGVPSLST